MSSKSLVLSFIVVVAALVACNPQTPQVTPTTTPLPTTVPVAPTEVTRPTLGEVQTVAINGFSFRPVEGWSLSTEQDSVSMEAPDAQINAGPGFFITGGYLEDFGINNTGPVDATSAIIESYLGSLIPIDQSFLTPPRRVAVAGVAGNDMDFIVPNEAQPYRGRITVLQDGRQIFLFLGLTPPERWDDEFKPLYEEVLRGTRMVELER